MPIRDENKARYPADWKAISKRIREAAGNRCQQCDVPNNEWVSRGVNEEGIALWRLADQTVYENGFCALSGVEIPDTSEDTVDWGRLIKVVLTVAHLDHQPENCADENLRAWCQRCHNRYDMPMRKAGIRARAKAAMAIGTLFCALVFALPRGSHADGLAAMLMPADPCGLFAPAIVEADSVAQTDLYAMNCGRIPTVAQMVAYVPGHKTMFWRQPEPLPSPVPIPSSVWMTLAGLAILGAAHQRQRR